MNWKIFSAGIFITGICILGGQEFYRHRFDRGIYNRIENLNRKLTDIMFLARGPDGFPENFVIVDIDDKSLEKWGPWPWPKGLFSDLVERLRGLGVQTIAFDFVFSSGPSDQSYVALKKIKDQLPRTEKNGELLKILEEQIEKSDTDWRMVRSIQRHGDKLIFSQQLREPSSIVSNTPFLDQVIEHQGINNLLEDQDGIVRRALILVRQNGQDYPSLGLQVASLSTRSVITTEDDRTVLLRDKNSGQVRFKVPADPRRLLHINFRGPPFTYPHVSMSELFNNSNLAQISQRDIFFSNVNASSVQKTLYFKDKIVLIGKAEEKVFSTPFGSRISSSEIQANIIDSIMAGKAFRTFRREPLWMALGMALSGLAISYAMSSFGLMIAGIFAGLWLVSWVVFSQFLLFNQGRLMTFNLLFSEIVFVYLALLLVRTLPAMKTKSFLEQRVEQLDFNQKV